MSLFPRFSNNTSDFAPLFRLLDDYDVHRTSTGPSRSSAIRAFQPKFDVREVKDAYELQGELPGIDQKDVHIEFTDPHTLIIKGRTERQSTKSNADAIEGSEEPRGRITDASPERSPSSSASYHKATVEDENAPAASNASSAAEGGEAAATPVTEVAAPAASKHAEPQYKYWVSERSIGEFHRSFSFPGRVDQDAVKASLKNGILSVVVPKIVHQGTRRIQISGE
ncbi:hypothetical protein MMC06_005791 [Schaereria dolodes]|nr:hypothetical protein [Schaereria dolodes]